MNPHNAFNNFEFTDINNMTLKGGSAAAPRSKRNVPYVAPRDLPNGMFGHLQHRRHTHSQTSIRASPFTSISFPPTDFATAGTEQLAWMRAQQGIGKYRDTKFNSSQLQSWFVTNVLNSTGAPSRMSTKLIGKWQEAYPSQYQVLRSVAMKSSTDRTPGEKIAWSAYMADVQPWTLRVAKKAIRTSTATLQGRTRRVRGGQTIGEFTNAFLIPMDEELAIYVKLLSVAFGSVVMLAEGKVTLPTL